MDEIEKNPLEAEGPAAERAADVLSVAEAEHEQEHEQEQQETAPPVARLVELPNFSPTRPHPEPRSIDLLLDVELPVTVELGHSQMAIKSILELGIGSVVRLEKAAGDPVDVLVNGKLVARGEVVVVDENFGVRILGLVNPDERLGTL